MVAHVVANVFIGMSELACSIIMIYVVTYAVAYVVPTASGIVGDAATFTVIIDLEPADLPLLPGMTGRVEIFMGDS